MNILQYTFTAIISTTIYLSMYHNITLSIQSISQSIRLAHFYHWKYKFYNQSGTE